MKQIVTDTASRKPASTYSDGKKRIPGRVPAKGTWSSGSCILCGGEGLYFIKFFGVDARVCADCILTPGSIGKWAGVDSNMYYACLNIAKTIAEYDNYNAHTR